jgi:hypothetical protein
MWVVLVLCLSVLAVVFVYGDAPRPMIDRMNPILATLVAFAAGILIHAIWRFRTHTGEWPKPPT